MAIDLSRIRASRQEPRPVDPIEIFQRLTISDRGINDLWLAQGDALREWHGRRGLRDIAIALNTGAGKTLVGLLIAQSLVNEARSQVAYVCSSIQLVEQTREKAEGYGLQASTYYQGRFDNTLYHEGKAPCITTYHALFNGKSVFFREDLAAIVFDDAHSAEHLLRDHFSLRITAQGNRALYDSILGLLQGCFHAIGKQATFSELQSGRSDAVLLGPPSELHGHSGELSRLLLEGRLDQDKETMFAWAHLKDQLDVCAVLVSAGAVTFTPPFVPVRALRYFRGSTRRVYLSATLVSQDAFARTFGRLPDQVIAPSTTAGECERLILAPRLVKGVVDEIGVAKNLFDKRKALVLVPTYARAKEWVGFADAPPVEHVTERVNAFKAAPDTPKLLLAARYDGVDLPGDTCRALIIDDLPMGVGPLERLLWEGLGLSHGLRSTIASRVVQSFGRISRGMSDHGVVLLTGDRLMKWLLVPKNLAALPPFLQKQLELGFVLSREATGIGDLPGLVDQFFGRDDGWVSTYRQFMDEAKADRPTLDVDVLAQLALAEALCAEHLWDRDYAEAARSLSQTLEHAFQESQALGAWHALWLARISELLGDAATAALLYARAHGAAKNIPAARRIDASDESAVSLQVVEIEQKFLVHGNAVKAPPRMAQDLAHLKSAATAAQMEEALRMLGEYFGLDSTRPEKEHGTGPDVLWVSPGTPSLCMEVKSGKDDASVYRKRDMGQLSDHVQWVRDNTQAPEIIPAFVGPVRKPSESANPPPEFLVIEVDQFSELAEKLQAALSDIAAKALPINLRATIAAILSERCLTWPAALKGMDTHVIRDL